MQTNSFDLVFDFAPRVIAASDLADLSAERRRALRLQLEEMLVSRLINALLNELDDFEREHFEGLAVESENPQEFFALLLRSVSSAREIVLEEAEMLFEELTSTTEI